jgi:alpha-aminoadipate carrier protein LysW
LCCASREREQPPSRQPLGGDFFVYRLCKPKEGTTKTMTTATCPECDADVTIPADAMENELIACAECGAELEIINLNPVELELAPEVEEDWGE